MTNNIHKIKGLKGYRGDGLFTHTTWGETSYARDRESASQLRAGFGMYGNTIPRFKCGHAKDYPLVESKTKSDNCPACLRIVALRKKRWKCDLCCDKYDPETMAFTISIVNREKAERAKAYQKVARKNKNVCGVCLLKLNKLLKGVFQCLKS